LIEHRSLNKGIIAIKEKLWETMLANWKLWPAAQLITFTLIPMDFRMVWVMFVNMFWQVYLNNMQHR
jgi:hypothetical protein